MPTYDEYGNLIQGGGFVPRAPLRSLQPRLGRRPIVTPVMPPNNNGRNYQTLPMQVPAVPTGGGSPFEPPYQTLPMQIPTGGGSPRNGNGGPASGVSLPGMGYGMPGEGVAPPTLPFPSAGRQYETQPLPIDQAAPGLGFADGGPILGPGGPRQDNLLIRASNGEVIVPADVVRAKGTEFFDKLKEGVRTKAQERSGAGIGFADGGYIDESAGLDMSASPGLPTLPAEPAGGSDQFAAPQPAPVTDPSVFAAPGASKPASSGLGLADYKAARSNDDMEYLKNLPTQQKIGLMLEAFGSGVNGRPNPVDALLENKRKRESEFRNELGTTIKMIDEGLNIVKKVSDPKARAALIEQMTRAAGPNGDVVKGALLAAGTAGEDEIRNIVSVLQNPRAQAAVVKASGGDAEKARKLMSDSDFMKRLEQTADQDTLPSVVAKMNLITRAMEKMPQFKSATGAAFTMKDLREQNAALPKEFQLTEAEFGAINRNQSFLIPYGLKTDKTAQVDQEAAARKAEQGQWGEPYKLNGALVQKNSVTNEVRTAVTREPPSANVGEGYTPEQIDTLARQAMKDKSVLFNIGRGTQGARDLQAINKRMADIMKEEGGPGTAEQRATFAADKKSLDKLVPQLDAVEAFSNNAIQQGKVLKGLAQKVDSTGVPVIERWIRAGRSSVAGDADVSEFNAQLQLYRTEAAKIITNPNLTSQLTDTARKEVQHFLDGNATAPQIVRVVDRLENDFGIRHKTLQDQVDVIKGRMAGGKATAPKADAGGASPPAGIPAGSKPVGYAPDGKRVWQDASGKKWKE